MLQTLTEDFRRLAFCSARRYRPGWRHSKRVSKACGGALFPFNYKIRTLRALGFLSRWRRPGQRLVPWRNGELSTDATPGLPLGHKQETVLRDRVTRDFFEMTGACFKREELTRLRKADGRIAVGPPPKVRAIATDFYKDHLSARAMSDKVREAQEMYGASLGQWCLLICSFPFFPHFLTMSLIRPCHKANAQETMSSSRFSLPKTLGPHTTRIQAGLLGDHGD